MKSDTLASLLDRPPDRVQESPDGNDLYLGWKCTLSIYYIIAKVENYKDPSAGIVRKFAGGNYINHKENWSERETLIYEEI